jgi:hypothetical protein
MASRIIQENKLIMIFKQRSENPLTSFRSNQRPVLRIVQMIGAFPIVKELGERHFIHAVPQLFQLKLVSLASTSSWVN